MPNTREKLIELLYDCISKFLTPTQTGSNRLTIEIHHGEIADHLIANGVTVQKWIPVTERLPEEDGQYLVFRDYEYLPIKQCGFAKNLRALSKWDFAWLHKDRGGFYGYDSEYGYHEVGYVTHWMPLPEPPKEVCT